jgi:DNA topoisomerase-3
VWEQALDMIEAGQMTLDTFIAKQSAWVGQLVQQYRGATLSSSCRRRELPAVRRTDAPAHGQERRVLVVQPLPGLQGHGAGRNRDRPAQRTARGALPQGD